MTGLLAFKFGAIGMLALLVLGLFAPHGWRFGIVNASLSWASFWLAVAIFYM